MISAANQEERDESLLSDVHLTGIVEDWVQAAWNSAGATELIPALVRRFKANDCHPGGTKDIRAAQQLLVDVYRAVRDGPEWEHTVLVVLFDEHGGLYDHMAPPDALNLTGETYTPTTKGFRAIDPTFDFTELGLRVPALIISPWIPAATVDHRTFDHSALLDAALRFSGVGIPEYLYCRTYQPVTFADLLTLSAARGDCPTGEDLQAVFDEAFPDYQDVPS
jgi:phospholipase C